MATLVQRIPSDKQLTSYFSTYNGRVSGLLREGATSITNQECLDYVKWTFHMMSPLSRRKQHDIEVANYLKQCSDVQKIALVRAYFNASRELSQAERDHREAINRELRGFRP